MSTDSDIDRFVELLDSIEGFGPWDAGQDDEAELSWVRVAASRDRCENFDVAKERAEQPREEQLEELVRIEAKVSEAAEAAADAAAHAVEATKAAEAASVARAARKAKTAKAAKVAATAKGKAGRSATAAKKAKAASTETAFNAPPPKESGPTGTTQKPAHVLKLRLTNDEREQIERMAAEKDLPVPDLARSLLMRAIGRSEED
jgi:Mrp family chromosome partitioning ATPase